ncbi:MAG: DUF4177 domain-containing protein [Clostridia bacterium]|nr:DUF4177 domain-containing protein [Clostridia bacterium]
MKQYICVSGPKEISVAKGQSDAAFETFQGIINAQAAKGWKYHSMETLTVSEKQGCFAQPRVVNHYMLIFERDV